MRDPAVGLPFRVAKHAESLAHHVECSSVVDGRNPHSVAAALVLCSARCLNLPCSPEKVAFSATIAVSTLRKNLSLVESALPAELGRGQAMTPPCPTQRDPLNGRKRKRAVLSAVASPIDAEPCRSPKRAPSFSQDVGNTPGCPDSNGSDSLSYRAAILSCQMRAKAADNALPVVHSNTTFINDCSGDINRMPSAPILILNIDDL